MLTKSMEYHYPAEFIVPTNITYDIGPIGNAFETEFEQQEIQIGLRLEDFQQGLLVVGGTAKQRFLTNFKMVYEAALAEENYFIITTNQEWRRMLDLIPQACVVRLGTDLTLNPLDAEGADAMTHVTLIAQAFAQAFYLSRLGEEHLVESLVTLLERSRGDAGTPSLEELEAILENKVAASRGAIGHELGVIAQALMNMGYGSLSQVFGNTNIPLDQLMNGITIVEIGAMPQQDLQFVTLCLLAKLLSFSTIHPQRHQVLIETADALMLHDPRSAKVRDIEHYLLDWVQQFRSHQKGIHLSFGSPARAPLVLLNTFHTIVTFKITSYEDVQVISNLLQFLPDRLVHSRERHDNYQVEFLKTQPSDLFILKRADIANAFPVRMVLPDFSKTHIGAVEELQDRVRLFFPSWNAPQAISRVALERSFRGKDVIIAQRILTLLQEYPDLGTSGIFSSLRSSPDLDLEMVELEGVLNRLVQLSYLAVIERDDGRGHGHKSYQLKERGTTALEEFIAEVNRRATLP